MQTRNVKQTWCDNIITAMQITAYSPPISVAGFSF